MRNRVVIAIVESAAPGAADTFPEFAEFLVVLGTGEVLTVLEKIEINCQANTV